MLKRTRNSNPASVLTRSEMLLSGLAVFFAILLVGGTSFAIIGGQAGFFLVASMGAAAVLLFAAPQSPMSQPWPVLGSHVIAGLTGVACFQLIPDVRVAAAMAVGLTVVFMLAFGCLHPPGGATALGAVVGGAQITQMGFNYVLYPVLLNTILILVIAWLVNNAMPGRRYPNSWRLTPEVTTAGPHIFAEDLDTALNEMGSYIDVSREDLMHIYSLAMNHANKRNLGSIPTGKVMTSPVFSFNYDTSVNDAWQQLEQTGYKAAPVVDKVNHVIGIVTQHDFLRATRPEEEGLGKRLRALVGRPSDKENLPDVVGHIMSSPVTTITQDMHVVDAMAIFTGSKLHHLPVIDQQRKLCGMLTRTDIMRALQMKSE